MTTITPDQLLGALRLQAASRDRIDVKSLTRDLHVHHFKVRVILEDTAFANLVKGDARLEMMLREYLGRDKSPLREPTTAASSGLRGSIDEVRRCLAAGLPPPEDYNGCLGHDSHGPTAALPGTPDKMVVLADRAGRRVALHHPLDARRLVVGRPGVRLWRRMKQWCRGSRRIRATTHPAKAVVNAVMVRFQAGSRCTDLAPKTEGFYPLRPQVMWVAHCTSA